MNSKNNIAIHVSNLSKVFKIYNKPINLLWEMTTGKPRHKPFWALRDISFDVKPGEVVGLIGRNGAGKSTLLRILTGTLDKTSGEVQINGRVSSILELGTGFEDEYTGHENIFLGGLILGMTREEIRSKMDWIINFSELESVIDQPFKTYSSGMQARLTFSTAISIDPDILIVDEALAVGDAAFQLKCFNKFQELVDRGKTILLVSHNINIINSLCERVMLLENGEVLLFGDSRQVTNKYYEILFSSPGYTTELFEEDIEYKDKIVDGVSKKRNSIDFSTFPRLKDKILNKSHANYGNKKAEIFDFGVLDESGIPTTTLEPIHKYAFYCRMRLNEPAKNLTVGMRIRTKQGVDLFAANTQYHDIEIPHGNRGNIISVIFNTVMNIGPGEHFVTFGVRNVYEAEFMDRYVDAFKITVLSDKSVDSASLVNLNESVSIQIEK